MVFQKEYIAGICTDYLKPMWLSAPESFPTFLKETEASVRTANEEYVKTQGKKLEQHFQKLNSVRVKYIPFAQKNWSKNTENLLLLFLRDEPILGLSSYLSADEVSGMVKELRLFLLTARNFAPNLSFSDLGQAIRNYLVYAMFLKLCSRKQRYTPAIFGYSMLYPVSDNYIDSDIGDLTKQTYNQMILDKINGLPVSAATEHDRKTLELLTAVEFSYPRKEGSEIYAGLALMLEAQEISLSQQSAGKSLSMEERLDISLFKGGVSVLIDRYLTDHPITKADMLFYLGFGFVLQLADDLQDITADAQEGRQTLFTLSLKSGDTIINKLLHFIDRLFGDYTAADPAFQDFIKKSSIYLILVSAQMSKAHFHPQYLKQLELYMPVHLAFVDRYTKDSALYPNGVSEKDLLKGMDVWLSSEP